MESGQVRLSSQMGWPLPFLSSFNSIKNPGDSFQQHGVKFTLHRFSSGFGDSRLVEVRKSEVAGQPIIGLHGNYGSPLDLGPLL